LITAPNIIPNTPNIATTTDIITNIPTDINLIEVNTFSNTSHNNSYGISINNGNPILNFLNNNLKSNITKVNNNN